MKRTSTTMKLSERLIELLCEKYAETKASTSIINGLLDFFLLPTIYQQLTSSPLHQLLTIAERRYKKSISIRMPEALYHKLLALSSSTPLKDVAEMVLAISLYYPLEKVDFSKETSHLLRVMGSKFDPRMTNAITDIFKTPYRKWETSIETCAGALGIHCNHCVSSNQVINDDDWQKINLYKAVKENPRELLIYALSLDASPEVFNSLKAQTVVAPSSKINYAEAARFLFLNATSYLNDGSTFLNGMNNQRWHKRLQSIYPLHQKLQNTVILEQDLFKVIRRYRKEHNAIFIVDPPYLDANVYKGRLVRNKEEHGREFGLKEHQRLAKLLRTIKYEDNNDFIYFCRITTTRKKNRENQIVSTAEELHVGDVHMNGMIDDLYWGFGFYYIDVALDNGTTERIITSFPFEGSITYGDEIA